VVGVVLEAGRVADWINEKAVAGGQLGPALQRGEELDERVAPLRFVAVDAGEETNADGFVAPLGPMNR